MSYPMFSTVASQAGKSIACLGAAALCLSGYIGSAMSPHVKHSDKACAIYAIGAVYFTCLAIGYGYKVGHALIQGVIMVAEIVLPKLLAAGSVLAV